jgi:hypothetical protein
MYMQSLFMLAENVRVLRTSRLDVVDADQSHWRGHRPQPY